MERKLHAIVCPLAYACVGYLFMRLVFTTCIGLHEWEGGMGKRIRIWDLNEWSNIYRAEQN